MGLFEKYKYPIIGGGFGFFLALLLVTIGFFKTLFILILLVVGVVGGLYVQVTGVVDRFLEHFK